MDAAFSIDVDVPRNLVVSTLSGFFAPDDVVAFRDARDAAHRKLRCLPNAHLTLVDIRDMQIQSQASVDHFRSILMMPQTRSKRLAFVIARSLARLQIQRAAQSREAAYFATMDEAEAWLFA